jgi:hypothetical protein
MRLRWPGLWAAFGLLSASPGVAAEQKGGTAESMGALRARCPTTRNLAPEAFAHTAAASVAALDEWQQRIRGNLQAEGPPANAEVVLRAFAGGSMTQSERSETATMLWRLPDGSWHFVAANHYPNRQVSPPPPPARLTGEQVEAARRSIVAGPLDSGQAAALDALLADPCLEAEPSIVAGDIPLRAGLPPMRPCYDAVPQRVEVVRAGRRRVFVQTCLHFLAGELIGLALYPRSEGGPSVMPASQTLASLESARRFGDQVLRASYGGEAWVNVTEAAGGYAFVHRASGFRCDATQPYEIEIYGPGPNEPTGQGGRCLRNTSLPVRGGVIKTEWEVVRGRGGSDVKRRVRDAADDWFSGYHGSAASRRIRMRKARFQGVHMWRGEVSGEPHVDARDDELTIAVGAEHDGWIVVTRATGSAFKPAAVEAAAVREWRRVLETRGAVPD